MSCEWRCEKVPREESCPESRTGTPSFNSVPNASASAVAALEHLRLVLKLARDGAMNVEAFRHRRQYTADILERLAGHGSFATAVVTFGCHGEACPAAVEPIGAVGAMRLGGVEFVVETLVEGSDHLAHVGVGQRAFGDKPLRIDLKRRRVILDGAVHQGLRERRLV